MPFVHRCRRVLVLIVLVAAQRGHSQVQPASLAGWSGWARCRIDVQGRGYTDQQTHTWTITSSTSTVEGAFRVYPGSWSVVGGGSLNRSQGTQVLIAQWATQVPAVTAPLAMFVRASDGRVFIQARHAQLRGKDAIQGYQQVTIDGKPQTPGKIASEAFEWAFPLIEIAPATGSAAGSSSPPVQGSVGLMQPTGSQATASCTWQFGQGSAAPAPPPTVIAQSVPTPPVAGAAPGSAVPVAPPPPSTTPSPSPATNAAALLTVTPNSVEQGALGTILTLTGASTSWQQGAPTVAVTPGIGVPITLAQAQSETSLLAQLDIQYAAVPGPRSVTVTTGTEVVTLPNAFTVTARQKPVLLTVTPNGGKQGDQSITVALTGQDTRWAQGKTTVTFGMPAVAPSAPVSLPVQSLTVNSATSATAVVSIPQSAPQGPYWVSVWDPAPSDWLKLTDGFTVTTASPSGSPPPTSPPLTVTPLNPSLLPTPALCSLRGPAISTWRGVYMSPVRVSIPVTPVAGATGYTVSRSDRGLLTATPLPPPAQGDLYFNDSPAFTAPLDYSASFDYTITAHYPQGCGSTVLTVSPPRPRTPVVQVDTKAGGGRVNLQVRVDDPQRDFTGALVTGPALPPGGRVLMISAPNVAWPVEFSIDGVPAGTHTWVVTAFWDIPGGRVMDVSTGARVTATVP